MGSEMCIRDRHNNTHDSHTLLRSRLAPVFLYIFNANVLANMERNNPKPRKRFSSDSSDVSVNASGSRAGFMASLLGRRSLSLSIDDDHPIDLLGNENGDEIKQEVEGIRNRTRTLSLGGENVDGDTSDETTPDQERRRSRTMSILSLIHI